MMLHKYPDSRISLLKGENLMNEENSSQGTTILNVEQTKKYLQVARSNGQHFDCISPSYLKMLDLVLKHIRVRLARGEWSGPQA
jgi:hypothetical protein